MQFCTRAEMGAAQKFVAYERVATARQGQSGLGLEAQCKTIQDFARPRDATLLGRFTEIESGTNPDRPEIAKPVISRKAVFLLTLEKPM